MPGRIRRGALLVALFASQTVGAQLAHTVNVGMGFGHHAIVNGNEPFRMSDDRVVIVSEGVSSDLGAVDESIIVISNLSKRNPSFQQIDLFALVGPYDFASRQITVLSSDAFLYRMTTSGEMGDVVVYVCQLDSVSGYQAYVYAGLPGNIAPEEGVTIAPLGSRGAVIPSPGQDGIQGSGDDEILVLDGLGTVGFLATTHALEMPLAMVATEVAGGVVMVGFGSDAVRGTTDDVLIVVRRDADGLPVVETHDFGLPLGTWLDGLKPLVLAEGRVVMFPTTVGFGFSQNGATEEFTVIRGLPGSPQGDALAVGGVLAYLPWGAPHPVAIGSDDVLLTSAGADSAVGTNDDAIVVVRDLETEPVIQTVTPGFGLGLTFWARQPLGLGSVVVTGTPGTDGNFGNQDDALVVIDTSGSSPSWNLLGFGAAVVDVLRVSDRGLWLFTDGGQPAYVTEITSTFPIVAASDVPFQSGRPVRVNDWTLITTLPGSGGGSYLDDPIAIVHLPFARRLSDGLTTSAELTVPFDPFMGYTGYPVRLEGATGASICGLAVSLETLPIGLASQRTSFVDWFSLLVILPGATDSLGNEEWTMNIPSTPGLSGLTLTMQAGILDGAPPLGWTLSTALEFHF